MKKNMIKRWSTLFCRSSDTFRRPNALRADASIFSGVALILLPFASTYAGSYPFDGSDRISCCRWDLIRIAMGVNSENCTEFAKDALANVLKSQTSGTM